MGLLLEIFCPNRARRERLEASVVATRRAYSEAKDRYDDALDRGDTRDQRRYWEPMRAARESQLAAERALKMAVGR